MSCFRVVWYINNKNIRYYRKARKKSKLAKRTENIVPLRRNINFDSIDSFSETKGNPEVVFGLKKCLSLLGNRTTLDQMMRPNPVKNLI